MEVVVGLVLGLGLGLGLVSGSKNFDEEGEQNEKELSPRFEESSSGVHGD
jgi:hypothetical protein